MQSSTAPGSPPTTCAPSPSDASKPASPTFLPPASRDEAGKGVGAATLDLAASGTSASKHSWDAAVRADLELPRSMKRQEKEKLATGHDQAITLSNSVTHDHTTTYRDSFSNGIRPPSPLDDAAFSSLLEWRMERVCDVHINSVDDTTIVLRRQRGLEKRPGRLNHSHNYSSSSLLHAPTQHIPSSPPRFALYQEMQGSHRQEHSTPRASEVLTQPSQRSQLRPKQEDWPVPETSSHSRCSSDYGPTRPVIGSSPTDDESLAYCFDGLLIEPGEDITVGSEANLPASPYSDPFPLPAQYTHASNIMTRPLTQDDCEAQNPSIPAREEQSANDNIFDLIDDCVDESFHQDDQSNKSRISLLSFGCPASHRKLRHEAEFYASQRNSIAAELADIKAKREAIHQQEQDAIDAAKASVLFEGSKTIDELGVDIQAAKDRAELQNRALDREERDLQHRLNLLPVQY